MFLTPRVFLKLVIFSLFFAMITSFVPFLSASDCSAAEDTSAAPKNFKRVQVVPPAEDLSKAPAGLSEAIVNIKKAVKDKSVESLMKYIADDIKTGFGAESGKKDFVKMWELDKSPERSKVWRELETIFGLGGSFDGQTVSYNAPYTFNAKTGGLNSFEYHIVTGKGVNVRKSASSKSEVVKKIDLEVVFVNYNEKETIEEINGESYPWKSVVLADGEQGYIYGKYLRSPVDFRLAVEKVKEEWKIVYFVSGD